jgi:hypothetical protein
MPQKFLARQKNYFYLFLAVLTCENVEKVAVLLPPPFLTLHSVPHVIVGDFSIVLFP